jgi:hypothetical protein
MRIAAKQMTISIKSYLFPHNMFSTSLALVLDVKFSMLTEDDVPPELFKFYSSF